MSEVGKIGSIVFEGGRAVVQSCDTAKYFRIRHNPDTKFLHEVAILESREVDFNGKEIHGWKPITTAFDVSCALGLILEEMQNGKPT